MRVGVVGAGVVGPATASALVPGDALAAAAVDGSTPSEREPAAEREG